jgi:hypothetical protein
MSRSAARSCHKEGRFDDVGREIEFVPVEILTANVAGDVGFATTDCEGTEQLAF